MLACCSHMTNDGDYLQLHQAQEYSLTAETACASVIPETLFVPSETYASINPGEAVYVLPCRREQPGGW